MFAKLTALVGGGPAFNYSVEEAYDTAWGPWSHSRGSSILDNSPVSVFKVTALDPADLKLAAARNGIKRLKMLRHPNVLNYKDSMEVQEKGYTVIYLVTEPVKPLKSVLQELDLHGQHRDEYLAMGMLQMANAVSFINNDCKMIHGHLCLAAIVVTESLDWKLHGFDLLSEHALQGDFALQHASWMVPNQYKPAEVARMDWGAVREGPAWAVDTWGLGCMMQEVFSGSTLTAVENLRRTDVIPPALLSDYQKLLSSQPARRLNPSKVAESKFLNNRLVEAVAFMENISVKDGLEKDMFFKRLPSLLPAIPAPVAQRKLLPLLARALEYGGAPASAVGSLLVIGKGMAQADFLARVVPCLSKLFASSDRGLRRNLLESMDQYGPFLTTSVIEEQIYPQLSNGFSDENAYIRELTLKSVLTLAPKMKQSTLTQGVLKHLSRLQIDAEPSIRANTTVLLGNIAQYLGDVYCKKVLLNAFTRALKDAFPPARIAALRALTSTIKHYSAEEAACRALPAIVPLAVDVLAEVRTSALQCMDAFTKLLRDNDQKLAKEAAAAGTAPTPAPPSSSGGMLGWAMSSLVPTSLVSGAAAAAGPSGTPSAAAMPRAPSGNGAAFTPAAPAPAAPAPAASVPAPSSSGMSLSRGSSAGGGSAAGVSADGWDNDEDLLDMADKEEQLARSRLARPTAGASGRTGAAARAAPAPGSSGVPSSGGAGSGARTGGHVAPPAGAGWGAGDEDGWDSLEASSGSAAAPRARPASSCAPRPRPVAAAGGAKKGAMKLGAQKLGAQKLQLD